MRFHDLFISYKIGFEKPNPFTKMPLYRKVFIVIILVGFIISIVLAKFEKKIFTITALSTIFLLVIYNVIFSQKSNTKIMLENYNIPYSKKRMNMTIEILKKYNIDIDNLNSLDRLIEEAKYEQIKSDYLSQFKTAFKLLGSAITAIIIFVAKKIGESATETQVVDMAIITIIFILLIFWFIFSLVPILKYIFYLEYKMYDEFISDLRQIKLFYSKK